MATRRRQPGQNNNHDTNKDIKARDVSSFDRNPNCLYLTPLESRRLDRTFAVFSTFPLPRHFHIISIIRSAVDKNEVSSDKASCDVIEHVKVYDRLPV